jgi:hypothetical protein
VKEGSVSYLESPKRFRDDTHLATKIFREDNKAVDADGQAEAFVAGGEQRAAVGNTVDADGLQQVAAAGEQRAAAEKKAGTAGKK